MLFSIRNLTKKFGGRVVLDLPELFLEEGTVHALLGPNGSGKSTLLSILSFLNTPTTGTIFYNGNAVSYTPKALHALRKEVILVDQHPILFTTSVYKNVEYGPKIRKLSAEKRRKIVEAALDRVRMGHMADAPADRLSGGETQRVAIARALACSPKVLLFDEPTASVDVSSRLAIENIIRDLHEDAGISIIMSTHNLLQASKLARNRVFLFEGRTNNSTYENIFSGKAVTCSGRNYCRIDDKILLPVKEAVQGEVRIALNPKSVVIHKDSGGECPPDAFRGKVFQMTMEDESFVRVVVDVGIPLNALVRKREFKRLGIDIGDRVHLLCGDHGVTVI